MSKVICTHCHIKMSKVRSGITIIELDEKGEPYTLWKADYFSCSHCYTGVAADFAEVPYAEQWEDSFHEEVEKAKEHEYYTFR